MSNDIEQIFLQKKSEELSQESNKFLPETL